MRNLIEIARIITRNKVSKIEVFDERTFRNKGSKFNQFYQSLLTNKFKEDRDAAAFFYGCAPSDPKYRQLKSRFRKRLMNTLFFLDINQPSISTYDRAYYSCNKEWAIVRAMLWYGAPQAAFQLARQVLSAALKFRFADFIVNASRMLRDHCAEQGDASGYETYHRYILEYSDVLLAELRSEELRQRVYMHYTSKDYMGKEDIASQVDASCDDLLTLSEQYSSPIVFNNMYSAWIFRYEMMQDFNGVLEVCERGEQYLQQNPSGEHEQKMAFLQIKKMSAYIHLENYREGRMNAERFLPMITEGSTHWFAFMEYYFLLAMHTGNYVHALAIFNQVKEQSTFSKLQDVAQEKWKLFEAYCDYLIYSEGKKNPVLQMQAKKDFQLNSLINKPLPHSKDYRAFLVLQLSLQILLLLESKTHSGLAERIGRLKKYANNQLRKDVYYRTVQFIRLLQQLSKAGFQREELSNTEKYYKSLQQRPFFYRGDVDELEVIPYEKLWGRILSALG
jgi:hypothetical protein